VKTATTREAFNDEILALLTEAGPVADDAPDEPLIPSLRWLDDQEL
jgi:hypothetical protein